MNYYLKEKGYGIERNASSKPRDDFDRIMKNMGFEEIEYETVISKNENISSRVLANIKRFLSLKKATEILSKGDSLVIQYPLFRPTFFMQNLIKNLNKRKIKTICIIHDVNYFRYTNVNLSRKVWLYYNDIYSLKKYWKIFVHNNSMKNLLIKNGFSKENLVPIKIFDYLIDDFTSNLNNNIYDGKIVIAGNLDPSKAKYCYNLPKNVNFNLYGTNYKREVNTSIENVNYCGSFSPDDLSFLNGSFGLVWDGDSIDTCNGQFGEYLRVNNPHKASLYLAAGLPIIIWKKAALYEFISKNNLGIGVETLDEVGDILSNMSLGEYNRMKKSVTNYSCLVRKGYFLKQALKKIGIIA
ncbi:galactofuranosyltransferase [Liquorilactobacillus mali]|uniref:galactofuranosyltransferase n=1 Tax=Liquorilactobacillus mali TaxID=1618 RepID=UPI00295490B3|nr:galactofuranosyltransferase [Liquorilactobacillus mali]MDV7757567.1 hypothetical protein [Liquorilactobacillus mali]